MCLRAYSVVSDTLLPQNSPPGSFVHGISQAKILEWVTIFSYQGSSRPWDRTYISSIRQADSLPLSRLGNPKLWDISRQTFPPCLSISYFPTYYGRLFANMIQMLRINPLIPAITTQRLPSIGFFSASYVRVHSHVDNNNATFRHQASDNKNKDEYGKGRRSFCLPTLWESKYEDHPCRGTSPGWRG